MGINWHKRVVKIGKSAGKKEISEQQALESIKKELEQLQVYDGVFNKLNNSIIFENDPNRTSNQALVQITNLLSEINKKKEINKKLKHLSYNISLLLPTVTVKDKEKVGNMFIIQKILAHEYSGINTIINDLNSFKSNLNEMKNLHSNLWKNELSLDAKALLEESLKDHEKFSDLYSKQKSIFLDLSSLFSRLTRDSILSRR